MIIGRDCRMLEVLSINRLLGQPYGAFRETRLIPLECGGVAGPMADGRVRSSSLSVAEIACVWVLLAGGNADVMPTETTITRIKTSNAMINKPPPSH